MPLSSIPLFTFSGLDPKSRRIWCGVVALVSFLVSFTFSAYKARSYPHTFNDEPGWISAGLADAHRELTADLNPDDWSDLDLIDFSDLNPQVGKTLIGLPLALSYGGHPPAFRHIWDTSQSYRGNVAAGNVPGRDLLLRARLICCFISSLAIVVVALIALEAGGLVAWLIALALTLHCTVYYYWSAHCVTDGSYLLFTVGVAYCCLRALRTQDLAGGGRWLIGSAICAALGAGVKVTGIVPYAVMIVPTLLRSAARADVSGKWRAAGRQGVTIVLTGAFVLLVANPTYWINVRDLDAGAALREVRLIPEVKDAATKSRAWNNTDGAFRGMCPHLYNLVRPLGFAYMFVRWRDETRVQEIVSAKYVRTGSPFKSVGQGVLKAHQSFKKEYIFILIGLAYVAYAVIRSKTRETADSAFVLGAYFAGQFLVLLLIPLDFDRYYIPIVVDMQLIVAFLVAQAALAALSVGRAKTKPTAAPGTLPGVA